VIDQFLREVERCATVNQFNRLRTGIENSFAPAEIFELIDGVRARGAVVPDYCTRWFENTEASLRGGGRPVQPYVRHAISPSAAIYAAPGTPRERASRTLVVAFATDALRLFMPISVFLQHVPAATHEVMLLIDPLRRFFLKGIAGFGDDLPATMRRIAELTPPSHYRRAVTLGCSAGGLAAIWTAVELGFERAVSVGGVNVESVAERVELQDFDLRGFDASVSRRFKLPDVLLVFGEINERDSQKAVEMARRLPSRYVTVHGASDHNVLYEVWKGGRLDAFLAELID
jgi:hypothetical protein